jgi:hypothetical protein
MDLDWSMKLLKKVLRLSFSSHLLVIGLSRIGPPEKESFVMGGSLHAANNIVH